MAPKQLCHHSQRDSKLKKTGGHEHWKNGNFFRSRACQVNQPCPQGYICPGVFTNSPGACSSSGQFRALVRRSEQSAFLDRYSTCTSKTKEKKKLWFSNSFKQNSSLEENVFAEVGFFWFFKNSALFSLCVGKRCLKSLVVFNKGKNTKRNSIMGWGQGWAKRALRTLMWIMSPKRIQSTS